MFSVAHDIMIFCLPTRITPYPSETRLLHSGYALRTHKQYFRADGTAPYSPCGHPCAPARACQAALRLTGTASFLAHAPFLVADAGLVSCAVKCHLPFAAALGRTPPPPLHARRGPAALLPGHAGRHACALRSALDINIPPPIPRAAPHVYRPHDCRALFLRQERDSLPTSHLPTTYTTSHGAPHLPTSILEDLGRWKHLCLPA